MPERNRKHSDKIWNKNLTFSRRSSRSLGNAELGHFKLLGTFRLDYEYEIEYECEFQISNQWRF